MVKKNADIASVAVIVDSDITVSTTSAQTTRTTTDIAKDTATDNQS
jgi:hypothetical protein